MNLLQIKIELEDSNPKISRTILIEDSLTFADLHVTIQEVMGWYTSHMHEFRIGSGANCTRIGEHSKFDNGYAKETGLLNEAKKALKDYLKAKTKFVYEYDFGDSWVHLLTVEAVLPLDPKIKHPVCTEGKGACPPDDCGGIHGYYHLLQVINNPKHPEYEYMREWMGLEEDEEFDPLFFDNEAVNKGLKSIFA